jgi:Domain of unknown function (DUF4350)
VRGRFSIFVFAALVVALLVALNAASYVRVEREPELEANPDRSTTNAGPTGTRAIYEYLEATGHKVARWRETTDALLAAKAEAQPATFVVVGSVRRRFTDEEKKSLMRWVARGGRLVVIDRLPEQIVERGGRWGVGSLLTSFPGPDSRADDVDQLLAGTKPVAPTQPTALAASVERVVPSRYASRLRVVDRSETGGGRDARANNTPPQQRAPARGNSNGNSNGNTNGEANTNTSDNSNDESIAPGEDEDYEEPTPKPTASPRATPTPRAGVRDARGGVGPAAAHPEDYAEPDAPVLNFTDERGALLADYTRGRGHVIVLSDPFIVANNGVSRADNLQLATNVIAGAGGLVAFDEFHQGRGSSGNQLVNYFAGTPVVAMFLQLVLIAAVVAYTRGRRFARPVPALRPDRRSKLEFVASMAELQQRARAFDLALENIYSRTRRALARYGGTDLAAPRAEIAAAAAARSGLDRARLETLMRDCEDAAAGQPITARRALALAAQLRELERALGIRMRSREIKQAVRL